MARFTDLESIDLEMNNLIAFKGVGGTRTVISIVNPKLTWYLKTHYMDGVGTFECMSEVVDGITKKAPCCMQGLQTSEHVIYPILEYSTGHKPNDYNAPVKFLFWKVTKKVHTKIKELAESGTELGNVDLLIKSVEKSLDNGNKYIEYDITPMTLRKGALWKTLPEVVTLAKQFEVIYQDNIDATQKLKSMTIERFENIESDPTYIENMRKLVEKRQLEAPKAIAQFQKPVRQLEAPKVSTSYSEDELSDLEGIE